MKKIIFVFVMFWGTSAGAQPYSSTYLSTTTGIASQYFTGIFNLASGSATYLTPTITFNGIQGDITAIGTATISGDVYIGGANGLIVASSVTASTFNAVGSAYQMNGVTVIDHDRNVYASSVTANVLNLVDSSFPVCGGVGGTLTMVNGNCIHTFTGAGTYSFTAPSTTGTVQVLVVGGGGGANSGEGGGGGGGFIAVPSQSIGSSSVTVTVGAGSVPQFGTYGNCLTAENSVFDTLTAIGGGISNGGTGGSGGAAGAPSMGGAPDGGGPGGAGMLGQGNSGGSSTGAQSPLFGYGNSQWCGGGGGGAGGAGTIGGSGTAGNGGDGLLSSISGSPTYYAGGGAGQCGYNQSWTPYSPVIASNGTAGLGGGGAVYTAGQNNTGGGGGATGTGPSCVGGGSGIVIVSYPIQGTGYVGVSAQTFHDLWSSTASLEASKLSTATAIPAALVDLSTVTLALAGYLSTTTAVPTTLVDLSTVAAQFVTNPSTMTITGRDGNGYSLAVSSGISAQCIMLQGGQVCGPGIFVGGAVAGATTFYATVNVSTIIASGAVVLQDGTSIYSTTQFSAGSFAGGTVPNAVVLSSDVYINGGNGLIVASSVTASTFNAVGSAYQMNGVTVIDHYRNIYASNVYLDDGTVLYSTNQFDSQGVSVSSTGYPGGPDGNGNFTLSVDCQYGAFATGGSCDPVDAVAGISLSSSSWNCAFASNVVFSTAVVNCIVPPAIGGGGGSFSGGNVANETTFSSNVYVNGGKGLNAAYNVTATTFVFTPQTSSPTATLGGLYYNSTTGQIFLSTDGVTWGFNLATGTAVSSPPGTCAETGGIVYDAGAYCVVVFDGVTGSQSWYNATTVISTVVVVAGGGGGGSFYAAGGGAGGVVVTTVSIPGATNYSVTVGAGGAGGTTPGAYIGTDGSNSSFLSFLAVGGGAGGGNGTGSSTGAQGDNGGSGGGSAGYGGQYSSSGTVNQGFGGGINQNTGAYSAGGGGSASHGGLGGSPSCGGAGGDGVSLAFGTTSYALGGGGGGSSTGANCGGVGGFGGGGQAGYGPSGGTETVYPSSGTANTGGGGGGGHSWSLSGFPGGSGIVIVAYLHP